MGAVFGAGVDVGVEPILRDRDVLDRVGGERARERRLHLWDAEDAGPGTRHRDADAGRGAGDKDTDNRVSGGWVFEFLIVGYLPTWKANRSDDLGAVECGLEHPGEEIVGRDLA